MTSGLAVIVSTSALYLAGDVIFSSLATATVIVVLAAMVSSVTVLPAVLAKLAARAERRAERRAAWHGTSGGKLLMPKRRRRGRATSGDRGWHAVLRPASRHPVVTLLVSVLVLLGLAAPALNLRLTVLDKDTFDRGIPAMQTYDRLTEAFPDLQNQYQVVVRANPSSADAVASALRDLGQRTQADPLFSNPAARLQTSADQRISQLLLAAPVDPGSPQATQALAWLRHDLIPATVGALPGTEVAVTGDVPRDADYLDHQNQKLPLVIGFLLLVTFVMTVVAFRSVVIGLIGVVLNLLSASAALGLLCLVFQGSWAQSLFGHHVTGSIGSRVPLFLFVILFGLSMDYQVFVVSRIREAVRRGVPTREAVLDGTAGSARVVTSAAVVMVTVFASFVFLHLLEMRQIGFSLAVAVLVDAFIIRIAVLPAALTLLGEASWWPSRPIARGLSSHPQR